MPLQFKVMRKFVILNKAIKFLILILIPTLVKAQVGINTTSPKDGSVLDIRSTDKGVYIPKVDISSINSIDPITGIDPLNLANAEGLLVYNENTSTGPGFFFWNGTLWESLGSSSLNDKWKTDGNAGTIPGTNYIGTSDAQDLYLATNGVEKMRILSDGRISVNGSPHFPIDKFTVNSDSGENSINSYSNDGVAIWGEDSGTGTGVIGVSATGYGIASFSQSSGIYNQVLSGFGQYNDIRSNSFGIYTELITAGGTGEIVDLGVQDGLGYLAIGVDDISSPTSGGDVFGFSSIVNTQTPTSLGSVFGSAFSGNQSGVGHGILIEHSGSKGRNAEFGITNSNNPDPAIISIHKGLGSVIIGQNQNNAILSTIAAAEFSYSGTDVDDHIGSFGWSAPSSGWGIGMYGYGGWYGVYGASTSAGFGVFSNGDTGATGTKSFVIDHPDDPANKILKHFSIESNEILNLYRGTEEFDSNGTAIITLPSYYNSINKDASYQLTAIGASMPNLYIQKEVNESGLFIIAGGIPGKKVSWILTSQRNDPYLKQNPNKRNAIVDKGERRGKYLTPALYNQPEENGISYKERKTVTSSKVDNSRINNFKNSHKPLSLESVKSKSIDNDRKEKDNILKEDSQNQKH